MLPLNPNVDPYSYINVQPQGSGGLSIYEPNPGLTYTNGSTFGSPSWLYGSGSTSGTGGVVQGVNTTNNRISGGSGSSYDPQDLLMLDSQIGSTNSGLGRLDNDYNIGVDNLYKSYNRGLGQIGTDRNQAQEDFRSSKLKSEGDYLNSRSGIRQESGNLFNSIQRLLGSAGAGRSTAASILAPFAVGREANSRFGQVQDAFGQNQAGLQTSIDRTMSGLTDAERRLKEDKENKKNQLKQGIDSNRASLQDRLAQLQLQRNSLVGGGLSGASSILADNRSRIDALLNSVSELSRNYQDPQLDVARGAFKAPSLKNYDYSRFQAPSLQGGRNPQADYVGPFVNPALRDEDERLRVQ
jgi:hypothetical protein